MSRFLFFSLLLFCMCTLVCESVCVNVCKQRPLYSPKNIFWHLQKIYTLAVNHVVITCLISAEFSECNTTKYFRPELIFANV